MAHVLVIGAGAQIDGGTFDLRAGSISIGAECIVEAGTLIRGPCVLGARCVVRHGCYIRGDVVLGAGCIVGGELKHVLALDVRSCTRQRPPSGMQRCLSIIAFSACPRAFAGMRAAPSWILWRLPSWSQGALWLWEPDGQFAAPLLQQPGGGSTREEVYARPQEIWCDRGGPLRARVCDGDRAWLLARSTYAVLSAHAAGQGLLWAKRAAEESAMYRASGAALRRLSPHGRASHACTIPYASIEPVGGN